MELNYRPVSTSESLQVNHSGIADGQSSDLLALLTNNTEQVYTVGTIFAWQSLGTKEAPTSALWSTNTAELPITAECRRQNFFRLRGLGATIIAD